MLASKIANLAGLRLGVVARWHLATNVGVDVGTRGGTVPAGWYGVGMDMVYCAVHIESVSSSSAL